ncbi:hypothetical protein HPP92_009941 [Vanilla planifolia]|uniref:Uncharacterized protein n=1 Tax=Vanilla planifolia TaxID=51239 RepID=A0A835R9J3_VANPL|nr:hypothetical protein HPP92_009941 [Vanilla planifolia]
MACPNPVSPALPRFPTFSRPHPFCCSFPSLSLSVRCLLFSNSSITATLHCSFRHTTSSVLTSSPRFLCKTEEYVFPDPIPEFAEAETGKFRAHLLERLSKKDIFGDSVEEIVGICTEILRNFLHTEYGGPGTLMVVPFIDMADTINERGLPGGPQAARAAVLWAQKNIDQDWKDWIGDPNL